MKKIIAILITLLVCISLISCGDDGVPEGMQDVTVDGQPFKLYVPSSWTDNMTSGISSASVRISNDKAVVTARYFAAEDPSTTLDRFVSQSLLSVSDAIGQSFTLISQTNTVLAKNDAVKLVYEFESDEKYTATVYYTKHKSDFILLSFYTAGNAAETFADNVSDIVANFTLADRTETLGDELVDKNTPEGMKIASADKLEYRFYVPKSWVCSSESGISEAYYPESDKTNVTVTSFSPDEEMSLKEYFELCASEYTSTINEYKQLSALENAKVAGLDAYDLVFSSSYGERAFMTRQIMLYSQSTGLFYNITYTATAENYQLHIADFEAMLDAFTFR